MEFPKFVSIEERGVWRPELDAIYDRHNNVLEDNNAFLFWQFNCKVRFALSTLRERIQGGELIKITMSSVAREAQVQYSGLYHIKRRGWVKEEIDELNSIIRTNLRKSKSEKRSNEKGLLELKQRYQNLLQRFADINLDFATRTLELEKAERTIKSKDKEINRLRAIIEDKLSN